MLTPHLVCIPAELKDSPQWVCWRPDKTPVNPHTGINARANDLTTWGEFMQAVHYWQTNGKEVCGIGYEFSPVCRFSGIDLDRCRNPKIGKIEPWARKIVRKLNSYTEISPSGRGLHILVKGKLPPGPRRKGRVEIYSDGRYFTVTGRHMEGTPITIEDRQTELMAVYSEIFSPKKEESRRVTRPSLTSSLTNTEVIARAKAARNGRKFERLWKGLWQGDYPSPSEADLALCSMLVYWIGPDPVRIDLLFRQSGLFRGEKWDRRTGESTYGARTIEKAISRSRTFP